ncbi:MAG: sulfatase-like hydrolase/transferase [Actinomycetota bacterium]
MPPDLLLLVCDTARADAFRPWGGPHPSPTMERLCQEGIVYARAGSTAPWTLPATASLFSGRLPTEHGITGDCFRWDEGRPTSPAAAVRAYPGPWLPEALAARGYRTWAASCNTWISIWGGFDRGFERFLDLRDRARLPKGRVGKYRRRAARLLGTIDRGGRHAAQELRRRLSEAGPEPLFAFVNLMETHAPYDPPRPYYPYSPWKRMKTRQLSGGNDRSRRFLAMNAGVNEPSPDYVRSIRSLYYNCARYEDDILGRFISAVEDGGRPTVVVVVADHGENLGDHGLFNHNSSLHETLLHVPLVVWGHRVDVGPGAVDDPVSFLGLPGWLLGIADGNGVAISGGEPIVAEYESTMKHNGIPADIQARIETGDPSRVPALVDHAGVAIRSGSLNDVAVSYGDQALYDLEADPAEEHDLIDSRPDAAREFLPLREAWERRRAARPEYEIGDVAEGEIADHLRTLGYID